MPAAIPVTGYPSDYRAPGIGIELIMAQGESISGSGSRDVVFVMPMGASGTYVANTLYGPIKSESEVATGSGNGFALHRGVRSFIARNKQATVYVLPMAATTGGSPAKATGTLTLTGTTATATFVWTFPCLDEEVSVLIVTGDTPTIIAANVAAIINAKTWLPITAVANVGVVTFSAKDFGVRGGTATHTPYRVTGVSPGSGITAAFVAIGTATAGADGSTTEAAQLATALAAIAGRQFYYYVYDNFASSTCLAALKLAIANKALPRYGRRGYVISGFVGTVAAFTTLANGANYERIECGVQPYSKHDPATIAGQLAASHQLKRETNPAFGFVNYAGAEWSLQPTDSQYWADEDDINDAIAAGASYIQSKPGGSYLVMSLTTRSKDGSGTYADFRAAESHRISVADAFCTELQSRLAPRLGDGLMAHPKLPDGTADPNAKIARGVTTEFTIRPTYTNLLGEFYAAGYTQKLPQSEASLQVVCSPINSGRIESGLSLYAIDVLSQVTVRVAEASAA